MSLPAYVCDARVAAEAGGGEVVGWLCEVGAGLDFYGGVGEVGEEGGLDNGGEVGEGWWG